DPGVCWRQSATPSGLQGVWLILPWLIQFDTGVPAKICLSLHRQFLRSKHYIVFRASPNGSDASGTVNLFGSPNFSAPLRWLQRIGQPGTPGLRLHGTKNDPFFNLHAEQIGIFNADLTVLDRNVLQ